MSDVVLVRLPSSNYITENVSLQISSARGCSANVGTLRGTSGEIAKMLEHSSTDICFMQETRFRRDSVSLIQWKVTQRDAISIINNKYKNNKHDWRPVKYLIFCIKIKQKCSCNTFFLHILQRYNQLPILGTLDMSGHQRVETLMFICMQKWTPSLTYFLRYCKGIANLQFWVLWECLIMPANNSITL